METYQRKPAEVKAYHWDGTYREPPNTRLAPPPRELHKLFPGLVAMHPCGRLSETEAKYGPSILTQDGWVRIDPGNWIVVEPSGHIYVLTDEKFMAHYQPKS